MGSRASNPPIDGRNHAHRSPLCVEVLRQKLEFDGGGGLTGQCKIRFRYSGRIPTTDHSRQKIAEMNFDSIAKDSFFITAAGVALLALLASIWLAMVWPLSNDVAAISAMFP
jgi:hypothetical protein